MSNQETFTIGAFFDGRPGHEKQTRGILEQLKVSENIIVRPVLVRRKSIFKQIGNWVRYIASTGVQANPDLADCHLLIGTGTHTHLPMLYQKMHYHIPVVTCMTPAGIIRRKFDLILAPQHDDIADDKNVVRTIGPPNLNENKGSHLTTKTLVLVGGIDPKSHQWMDNEIIDSVKKLILHDIDKDIIISSSPRTPAETVTGLANLAEEFSQVSFFDYKDTPSGWVENECAQCEQVWVTADSISMVYEALSSGCKVGLIPVRWLRKSSKFIESEKFLHAKKMVIDLQSYLAHNQKWEDNPPLNEARRCADEIIKRFLRDI